MNASNKELDLRVRRTYKFLWEALIGLMHEQDFEALTVTDICDRAMVHRTTFYKHYEDKHALLFHGIQDQLNLFFDELNLPIGTASEMSGTEGIARLVAGFEHVRQHERFYRLMLCGEGVGKFYTLFKKSLVEHFLQRSEAYGRWNEKPLLMRSSLRAHSHAGLLISTFAWWLENNCPYTPTEMAQFLWEDAFA